MSGRLNLRSSPYTIEKYNVAKARKKEYQKEYYLKKKSLKAASKLLKETLFNDSEV